MATRKASSSKPIGAIVGGTVGGVVLVALLLIAAYTLGRRRRTGQVSTSQISSPPMTGEKEKFFPDHKATESTDDGPQYAINSLPHYGQPGHKQLPTTPSTANSAQTFLPEAHSFQNTAFSVPSTPDSHMNFITMASAPSSYRGHIGEASSASISSRISYNPNALSANMSASRAAHSPNSIHDATDVNRREVTIEPFILPNTSLPSASHNHKAIPGDSGAPLGQIYYEQQVNSAPTSPQDIDPLSPSTSSAGATIIPFVLPPPPQGAMTRGNAKKGSLSSHVPRRVISPPAPPYTAQATGPGSPTLVDGSQDSS